MKSRKSRRRVALDHCSSTNKEDRISTLPDELLHHILSSVESNVAVQTCVLSKRWVNLWSTLPFLKFESIHFDLHRVYYRKFVTDFLGNRNQESDTTTFRIQLFGFDELATRQIVDYAISHNVKHFIVSGGEMNFQLSFPVLTYLSLTFCRVPLMNWSLPSLTTLKLEGVRFFGDKTQLSFEGFKKLKNLTLAGWELLSGTESFVITSSTVTSLAISARIYRTNPVKFVVSTPNLLCFRFYDSNFVPVFYSEDGFPCLKRAYFDIGIGKYEWKEYNVDEKDQIMHKLIGLFHEFRGTKFLTLSVRTVQVLSRVTDFLVSQPSPFGTLKFLTVRGYIPSRCNEIPIDSINRVINYLLNNSSGTEVFIQDFRGNIKKYNPEENTLLHEGCFGFRVVNSKQGTAFNKQSTIDVQVNGCGFHAISPKQTTTFKNQGTSTDKVNVSFSLWEDHQVYPLYVDLLTQIKQNHPETFEHFAPQTEMICTLGLNTLCSSVGALSRVCRASFTDSTIRHYRGLFADLGRWGFNTTWLVNLLNKADEIIKSADMN